MGKEKSKSYLFLKEFLKPSLGKIILTIVLSLLIWFLSFIGFTLGKGYTAGLLQDFLLLALIAIFLAYLFSCLIMHFVNKIKNRLLKILSIILGIVVCILITAILFFAILVWQGTFKTEVHPYRGGNFYECIIIPDCNSEDNLSYTCLQGHSIFTRCHSVDVESLNLKVKSLPYVVERNADVEYYYYSRKNVDYTPLLNSAVSTKCEYYEKIGKEIPNSGFVVNDNVVWCHYIETTQ